MHLNHLLTGDNCTFSCKTTVFTPSLVTNGNIRALFVVDCVFLGKYIVSPKSKSQNHKHSHLILSFITPKMFFFLNCRIANLFGPYKKRHV